MERCVAIAGLRALETMAIKSVIREAGEFRAEAFDSFEALISFADRCDAYVVSSDIFISNLEFFLPRKQKTIVVNENLRTTANWEKSNAVNFPLMIFSDSDESYIESIVGNLLDSLTGDVETPGELSLREIEVLRLISAGKLNKEIADELCISVNTVITHRKNLSSKLGIKSASGLSLYAMMNGLI